MPQTLDGRGGGQGALARNAPNRIKALKVQHAVFIDAQLDGALLDHHRLV